MFTSEMSLCLSYPKLKQRAVVSLHI
jgi:hypothetical protein